MHPETERLLAALPGQPALRAALGGPGLDATARLSAAAAAGYAIPPEALPALEAALAAAEGKAGGRAGGKGSQERSHELGDAALDQVQGGHWPVRNLNSPFD
ncbi:hypothetical protein [Pseudoroseomonas cervicalis]|uniref:hypothetical protein n=1 Tax=Teichococcus cervicalis TaxID=204525 RepID=UPI00278560BB|nr:hypothetical protein [Pseudoroseomonas cervicalis]MDQ1078647.1 hypothetical protein [Pseudoroseomonas cervicalis]